MLDVLRFLRRLSFINFPIRVLIKSVLDLSSRLDLYFSMHWPVTGKVNFRLPDGEQLVLYSTPDEFIPTRVFWKGYTGYEAPSVTLFYHLSKNCNTIIDIGAHVGLFSIIAAASNPNAQVFAFEPVGFIHERLVQHVEMNRLDNVKAERLAIADTSEPIKLYVPRTVGSSLPLASSTKKAWAVAHAQQESCDCSDSAATARAAPEVEEIIVDSISLDTYKERHNLPPIDLIKMDCEMSEIEALRGMNHILENDRPVFLIEVFFPELGRIQNDSYLEIERIMKRNHYYSYLISEAAAIRMDRLEYNPDHGNYLFSPKRSNKVYMSYADMDELLKNVLPCHLIGTALTHSVTVAKGSAAIV